MCFWRILYSYSYDRMLYPNLQIRYFFAYGKNNSNPTSVISVQFT